jgi:hypothetical protein
LTHWRSAVASALGFEKLQLMRQLPSIPHGAAQSKNDIHCALPRHAVVCAQQFMDTQTAQLLFQTTTGIGQ